MFLYILLRILNFSFAGFGISEGEFKGRIRGDIYINREVDFIKFDGVRIRKKEIGIIIASLIVIELVNKNL